MSNKSAASLRSILEAVLAAEWRDDDLYQVPLILSTLLNIDSELEILGEELSEVMSIKVRFLVCKDKSEKNLNFTYNVLIFIIKLRNVYFRFGDF